MKLAEYRRRLDVWRGGDGHPFNIFPIAYPVSSPGWLLEWGRSLAFVLVATALATLVAVGWLSGARHSVGSAVEVALFFSVFTLLCRVVSRLCVPRRAAFAYGFLTVLCLPTAGLVSLIVWQALGYASLFRGTLSTTPLVTTFVLALATGANEVRRATSSEE